MLRVLGVLLALCGAAHSEERSPRESENKAETAQGDDQHGEASKQITVPANSTAPTVINVFTGKHSGQERECSQPKDWKEWPAFAWCKIDNYWDAERTIAAFTVILAISTTFLWWSTRKLWIAGEKQLRHARRSIAIQSRDMRASIEIAKEANKLNREIFAAGSRPSLEVIVAIGGDFHSDGSSGLVELVITAQNVGSAPALNTVCRVMTFPNMYPVNETEQYRLLSESMKSDRKHGSAYGDIIFPGRTIEFSKPSTTATWFKANMEVGKPKGAPSIPDALGVCVCVDYMSSNDDRHYETGYIFLLLRKHPQQSGTWIGFELQPEVIPKGYLQLMRHMVGSYAT
jgi:hypothetical protein